MRPLAPPLLREHLIALATPPHATRDADIVRDFYLDQIKTHCIVAFADVAAAERVRAAVHGAVWPEERSRKPLWADFVPASKVREWIETEKGAAARRGAVNVRWEIAYEPLPSSLSVSSSGGRGNAAHAATAADDDDRGATSTAVRAVLREAGASSSRGGAAAATAAPPSAAPAAVEATEAAAAAEAAIEATAAAGHRSSGVQDTVPPLAPASDARHAVHGDGTGAATDAATGDGDGAPRGTGFVALDALFSSTLAKPKLYYQPVPKSLASRRLAELAQRTSRRWSASAAANARPRDGEQQLRWYSFEDDTRLVDCGPEYAGGDGRDRDARRGGRLSPLLPPPRPSSRYSSYRGNGAYYSGYSPGGGGGGGGRGRERGGKAGGGGEGGEGGRRRKRKRGGRKRRLARGMGR
jgi:hypothetical protein